MILTVLHVAVYGDHKKTIVVSINMAADTFDIEEAQRNPYTMPE